MDYAVSRARLKNYFSTVTYIDDRFDHCIIDEPLDFGDEETVDTPPLPILGLATPPIATGEIAPIPHADEKDMEINLSTILAALNDEKALLYGCMYEEESSIAEGIDTPPFQMSLTIHFIITLRQETVKFRDAKHFISV